MLKLASYVWSGVSSAPMSTTAQVKVTVHATSPHWDLFFQLSELARGRSREDVDYLLWRRRVERFKRSTGAHPLLDHIPDESWRAYYGAQEGAVDAVINELQRVDD